MGKAHVTAIIQALQETIENLSVNGCSARSKISNHTVDSQYVQALEDDYGDEIDTIVENIPDDPPPTPPGPTLPSVSNFGFIMHNNPVTINAGNTNSDFYVGTTGQPATYDSGKLYGAISALDSIGGNKVNQTYISLVNDNGEIAVKNVSQASITIEVVTISECSSNQASVVTVYNSSNTAYNAFKFTSNGTDYYYVLDGTQVDWTDDLSSIGYIPTLEAYLATGNKTVQWQTWHWLYIDIQCTSFVQYDGTKSYKFIAAYKVDGSKLDLSAHMSQIILGRPDSSYSSLAIIDYYSSFTAHRIEYTAGPKLPTVSLTNDFDSYNWLTTSDGSAVTVNADSTTSLYLQSNHTLVNYDSTKSYAILQWQKSGGITSGRTEFDIVNNSGYIGAKNVSNSSQTFKQARVAVCSSNQAEVITVYDSQNASYNAFKFTLLGSDRYYVLDGTQTNWTNDLSSIGYSLYLKLTVLDGTQDRYCGPGSVSYLYLNGNSGGIVWVSGKYTLISVYTLDGNQSPYTFSFGTANGLMTLTSSSYSAVACYCYVQVS